MVVIILSGNFSRMEFGFPIRFQAGILQFQLDTRNTWIITTKIFQFYLKFMSNLKVDSDHAELNLDKSMNLRWKHLAECFSMCRSFLMDRERSSNHRRRWCSGWCRFKVDRRHLLGRS